MCGLPQNYNPQAHRRVVGDELLVGEEPGVGLLVGPLQEGDHLHSHAGKGRVGQL